MILNLNLIIRYKIIFIINQLFIFHIYFQFLINQLNKSKFKDKLKYKEIYFNSI